MWLAPALSPITTRPFRIGVNIERTQAMRASIRDWDAPSRAAAQAPAAPRIGARPDPRRRAAARAGRALSGVGTSPRAAKPGGTRPQHAKPDSPNREIGPQRRARSTDRAHPREEHTTMMAIDMDLTTGGDRRFARIRNAFSAWLDRRARDRRALAALDERR
jgi:hypothetical protein